MNVIQFGAMEVQTLCLVALVLGAVDGNGNQTFVNGKELDANGFPKLWHRYLKKFLCVCLHGKRSATSVGVILTLTVKSALFVKMSVQRFDALLQKANVTLSAASGILVSDSDMGHLKCKRVCTFETSDRCGGQNFNESGSALEGEENVRVPRLSGHVVLPPICEVTITLEPSPNLSMNFSLREVYFTVLLCRNGKLVFHNASREKPIVVFCGRYSDQRLHLRYRKILIAFRTEAVVKYRIHVEFSVMDLDCVETLSLSLDLFPKPQVVTLLAKRMLVLKYLLTSEKNEYLYVVPTVLEMFGFEYVIFNGPGDRSLLLRDCSPVCVCSHYLCTVVVWAEPFAPGSVKLLHGSAKLQPSLNFSNTNTSQMFQVPGPLCTLSPYVLQLHAEKLINVSVLELAVNGLKSWTCTYAGIAVFDTQESETLCTNHSAAQSGFVRNMYSSLTGSVMLVCYWYEEYSKITTTLAVSQTDCSVIRIDICEYDFQCKTGISFCQDYISVISKQFGVLFHSNLDTKALEFSLEDDTCFVLQHSQAKRQYRVNCHLMLVPGTVFVSGHQTDIEVKGILDKQAKVFRKFSDNVFLMGKTEKFTFPNKSVVEQCRQRVQNDVYFCAFLSHKSKASFHVLYSFLTPTPNRIFKLETTFHGSRNQWLEIVVHQKISPTKAFSEAQVIPLLNASNTLRTVGDTLSLKFLSFEAHPKSTFLSVAIISDIFQKPQWTVGHRVLLLGQLHWISSQRFSVLKPGWLISLPGQIQSVSVKFQEQIKECDQPFIEASWIQDTYIAYQHFRTIHSESYLCDDNVFDGYFHRCVSFPSVHGKYEHLNYTLHEREDAPHATFLLSWKGAFELCSKCGGYLPYFVNALQQKEVLAIVRMSNLSPALEALFIGLVNSKVKRTIFVFPLANILKVFELSRKQLRSERIPFQCLNASSQQFLHYELFKSLATAKPLETLVPIASEAE